MTESWITLLTAYSKFQRAAGHSPSTRKLRMIYTAIPDGAKRRAALAASLAA